MNFKPWYERFPERLKEEANAYEIAHLDFLMSVSLLDAHGIVVFEGTVTAAKQEHRLQVVYPSGFPLVRPEVVAATAVLGRHQNPYEANLCLLPNGQTDWCETYNGALMVQQAVSLMEASQPGTAALADLEVDAPEPYST